MLRDSEAAAKGQLAMHQVAVDLVNLMRGPLTEINNQALLPTTGDNKQGKITYVTCDESYTIDGVDLCKSLVVLLLSGHSFRAIVVLGLRLEGRF